VAQSGTCLDQKIRKPVSPAGKTGFLDGGGNLLEFALEVFACAELDAFRRFDLDALACFRVHAHAGFAVYDFESSETDELHDFALFEMAFDTLDDGVDGALGVGFGAVEFFLDGLDKFYFVHFGCADFCFGKCLLDKRFLFDRAPCVNGHCARVANFFAGFLI
jgi:hypothetical protein